MRSGIFYLVLFLMPSLLLADIKTTTRIIDKPFEEVIQKAEKGDKILVMFTASWCGPCQLFKSALKNDERLKKFMLSQKSKIHVVIIDIESGSERALFSKWGLSGVPNFVVCDHKGNGQFKFRGFTNTSDWLRNMERALKKAEEKDLKK